MPQDGWNGLSFRQGSQAVMACPLTTDISPIRFTKLKGFSPQGISVFIVHVCVGGVYMYTYISLIHIHLPGAWNSNSKGYGWVSQSFSLNWNCCFLFPGHAGDCV